MTKLIAAEFKKLSTTRTVYLLLLGAMAVSAVSVLDPSHDAEMWTKPFYEQTFVLFAALLSRIFILVLGVRAMADEFRHRTITSTLLGMPDRKKVIVAKAITLGVTGAAFALAAWTTMAVAATVLASADGASLELGIEAWRSLGGMVLAGATWAVIGVALGAILRSQVTATVGGLLWLMGMEDVVGGLLGDAGKFLPGQAGLALPLASNGRIFGLAAAVLLAYGMAFLAGSLVAMRRDVT